MKKILIVTSSIDYTVDYLIIKYSHMANFFRFNIDLFSQYKINICVDGWELHSPTWSIKEHEIDSIYYRKPMFPDLSEFSPEYRIMIERDILSIVEGIVNSFEGKVLTKPYLLRKAENKIYQLMLADKIGFSQPKTLITNHTEKAKQFVDEKGTVIKPLTTAKIKFDNQYELYTTKIITKISESINLMPIYLQYYQNKWYEVRITMIREKAFAVKIYAADKIDWRRQSEKNSYELIDLPADIYEKCTIMLEELDIEFGAFDFIIYNEDWTFLEVNPNGQWLWLEEELHLDISKQIVLHLIK